MKIGDMIKGGKRAHMVFSEDELINIKSMADAFAIIMKEHQNLEVDNELTFNYFKEAYWLVKEKLSPFKPLSEETMLEVGDNLIFATYHHIVNTLEEAKREELE